VRAYIRLTAQTTVNDLTAIPAVENLRMTMTAIRSVADVPPIDRDQRKPESDNGWRVLFAKFGRCSACNRPFGLGEVILWNVHTKLTLHPKCCSDTSVSFKPAPHPGTRTKAWTYKHLES
jgi:hypothetical protein